MRRSELGGDADRRAAPATLRVLHRGVSVILAESGASIGAFLNCPPGKGASGSEINASHLRPERAGGRLTASGTLAHAGKRRQVWEVKIEGGKPVCASRCSVVRRESS